MQYSITQKVRLVFLASLLFIFAISYLSFTSISQLVETSGMVSHTQQVIITLGQLHATIREAETSQRGYLITGNRSFLDNYHLAQKQVEELQQEMADLIKDNPKQQENFRVLSQLIKRRFQRLDGILLNYSQTLPYDLDASNQTMQEVKKLIQRMQNEEDHLLDIRSERENYYASRVLGLIALFVLTCLSLMLVAYFRIRRDVNRRLTAERTLAENNQQLERKVEERAQEITKNEERYRFMAESIPHIVWTAEPNGDFDYVSQQWMDYSGATLEESLGWNWGNFIHPDDLQATIDIWQDVLEKEIDCRIEHRVLGKDGEYRWMQSRAVPYKNGNGKVTKWFGTSTLIDDEVKAKEAALQQEELLLKITDALPVLISFVDAKQQFRFVNQKYEDLYQIPRAEIIGKTLEEVTGPIGYSRIKRFIEEVLSGVRVSSEVETYYENKGDRYIKFTLIPRIRNRRVEGFYGLVDDITELKKIEGNLRLVLRETETKNQELKRINQILDDFVSMAAHDLKSPVSNLKLSVLLINKLNTPEEKLKIIGHLDQSIKRLDLTLSGLLEIVEVQHVKNAKIVTGYFQDVLDEVMVNFQERLKEGGGEIKCSFDGAPAINFIRPYLVSIVSNLVSNAIKYRSPKRPLQLEICTHPQEEGVLLSCKDNGIGMDLEKVGTKLFKPFKRFNSEVEGTGVGLHLVKSIIERNGGTIVVESQVDKGTSFKCFLKNMQITAIS